MNANHPHEALSVYLDGELSGEELLRLEDHLSNCPPCTVLLADMKLMARAGAEEEVPPVPAALSPRIMTHIPRGVAERQRHWIHRMPLATAASLAAVAVLWVVFRDAPSLSPDPEFGRGFASDQATPIVPEEARPPQPEADGGPGTAGTSRQELKKVELNDQPETPSPKQKTAPRLAHAPSGQDRTNATDETGTPTATAAPDPAQPRPLDRADRAEQEQLRLTGRLKREPTTADAPLEPALAPEAVSTLTQARDPVETRAHAARASDSVAKRSARMQEAFALPERENLPTSASALVLREAGREIRVTDAGQLSVRTPRYHCTILLFPGADEPESTTAVEGEVLSWLRHDFVMDHDETRTSIAAAWTLTREGTDGVERLESDSTAADLRWWLQSLVRDRFRSLLEKRCGPLPQSIRGNDQNP